MEVPKKLLVEIARHVDLIVLHKETLDEAVDTLEITLSKSEFSLYVSALLRKHLRQKLKANMASRVAMAEDEERTGQQALRFPDLTPLVEIGIATFKHQNAMNLDDWNAAVVQAQVKVDNASGHLDRVLKAREQYIDLYADEDERVDLDEAEEG